MRSPIAVANFDTAAAGSTARPREICHRPAAIAPNSATYCTAKTRRHTDADDDADEADKPQQRHGADHAEQRQRAALPRGLWRPEEGVGEDDEGDRIKRRRQPIMQLRSILVRLRRIERIVGPRPQQFPDVFLAHGIDDVLRAAGELRKIERVAIESHDARIALAGFEPLDAAAFEHQERALVVLHDLALLGEIGGMFIGIAAVVDENADQETVRPAVCDVESEIAADRREAAGLNDIGEDVGAHLRTPVTQFTQAARRDIGGDDGDQDRNHEGCGEKGPQQPPRRNAGGIHHDDLGV